MIRRVKFVFAALLSVFMLGASAVAVASAAEMVLPEFINAEGATFGSEAELKITGGSTIKCNGYTGKFTFLVGSKRLGLYTLDLTGCAQGGEECFSLGDKGGVMLIEGEWHLVLQITGTTMLWLIAFLLPNEVHIECPKAAVTLLLALGSLLGLIVPVGKRSKAFEITVTTTLAGETYENNKAEQVLDVLEISQMGGKQKKYGISSAKPGILSFPKENEIID